MSRRVASPDEALAWVLETTALTLLENFPKRPQGVEMWWAVLTLLPELHAQGIHAEWLPGRTGLQFSAFQTVADIKRFWKFDGSDEAFESVLRDVPNINLLTLSIGGKPTRVAEPFIPSEAVLHGY